MGIKSTAADRLRKRIFSGEFGPGQRLIETDLIEVLGASRGAIRKALVELETEGLVVRTENRGAKVRRTTVDEALQVTEARRALEELCASAAAASVTNDDRDRLNDILDRMRLAVSQERALDYSLLNAEFHQAVSAIGHQGVAAELIAGLRNRAAHHQFRLSLLGGRMEESLVEHEEIAAAICAGDPKVAGQAMHEHLESVAASIKLWDKGGFMP